jgi:flagellar biosynthetic protein FlhB
MAEGSFQEKTEQATPKRRDEARKKGQVARSMELNSVAILFFGLISLMFLSSYFFTQMTACITTNFGRIPTIDLTPNTVYMLFKENGLQFIMTMAPLLMILVVVGILINFAQVGALFTFEPLTPKLDKLDVTKGFQRILSRKTLVSLFRDLIKVSIIGYIAFITIRSELPSLYVLVDQGVGQILKVGGALTLKIGLRVSLALLFLAILDYAFQKFEYEKDLRMTRQEIKEEYREFEGDPQIKARIRRIQREMARKRMLKEVETADVVITNPTHIAVALRYDMTQDVAPVVVAMGERLIAEKIKEVARKFNIPVIENKPLARALFELAEIGVQIPAKLYRAVAEVLAFVYKQKGRV